MEHYHHTQTIEWKANFGVWTLLAGAIYLAKDHVLRLPPCAALVISSVPPIFHGLWLHRVLASEQTDKMFWVRYRREALELLRGQSPLKDEEEWERGIGLTLLWLALEVGVTCLLCGLLFLTATLT